MANSDHVFVSVHVPLRAGPVLMRIRKEVSPVSDSESDEDCVYHRRFAMCADY